jgi:uncharacterized membrane protein
VIDVSNNQMTSKQRKELSKAEFHRKFGRYWLIYIALGFTAVLSFVSGLLLPFMKPDVDVPLTWGTAAAAVMYAMGFLLIGEGAALFWFDKIVDQDPDNNQQKITAGLMIAASVLTSATTALAASYIVAYWIGVFDTFTGIPAWAQKWIAVSIPVLMVVHVVAGIIFKSSSDEATSEREANAKIHQARNEANEARQTARANWIISNAPRIAQEMGEMEAEDELDALRAKIREQKTRRQIVQPAYNQDETQVRLSDNPNGSGAKVNPQSRRS